MKKRVLIFIVSYNAERFIESVLDRIPEPVWNNDTFDAEVLIIDDQSSDRTFDKARSYARRNVQLPITVLYNPKNQGYGGNQKIGYHYAVQNKFDAVVMLHGDGQYPPEIVEQMVMPILAGEAEVVLGSRMINKGDALKGRMPLYKWVGNQILTFAQNTLLGSHLAEFHTGYRAYSVATLASVPFMYNSDYFDFDTDILIQVLDVQARILEIPIPTFYGVETSHVDGMKYAGLIMRTTILSRLMKWSLFYHPKFDYKPGTTYYEPKFGFPSSHEFALRRVRPNSRVLDIGVGAGFITGALARKGARVTSVDTIIQPMVREHSEKVYQTDVETFDFDQINGPIDTVLLLDSIEHFRSPEHLLQHLRQRFSQNAPTVLITTGNIGFLTIRLGLLAGQFNYGKRGILDQGHTRLFTFYSLRNLLASQGYDILEEKGIPAPFPLAIGDNPLAQALLRINYFLICVSKTLFSYQMAFVGRPRPTLAHLLENAQKTSEQRENEFNIVG